MSILALRQNFRVSASPAEEVEKEAEKVVEKVVVEKRRL